MPTYLTPGVYIEEKPSGSMPLAAAGTAVAAFIGFTQKAPIDDPKDPEGLKPRLVTNWSQYQKLYGGFTPTALLPHAVYGFFLNGGGRCYIVRIPHRTSARAALELEAGKTDAIAGAEPPKLQFVNITEADDVSVEIAPDPAVKEKPDQHTFTLTVQRAGETDEKKAKKQQYTNLTLGPSGQGASNVVEVINGASPLIEVVSTFHTAAPVKKASHKLAPPTPIKKIETSNFNGDADKREGVQGLVIKDDVTMVMVPDLWTVAKGLEGQQREDLWKGVQRAVIDHCSAEKNRMAILDPPPDLSPQDVVEWREKVGYDSMFATLYYPWLKVDNPASTNGDKTIMVPPCGHMAGIWARTDETRGVWKAPANESVFGALDVASEITKGEQAGLNPIGINAIRGFGSRGLKVWGARTLSVTDPSWRYINVRRLFNMIETTIMDGTQWVVFEPNDQALWQRVNRTVYAFLLGLWRDGALFGASPDEAFFVKCDAETNPPESIDEGKLIVEVGIAPVKPAEFVIFRFSQKTLESSS